MILAVRRATHVYLEILVVLDRHWETTVTSAAAFGLVRKIVRPAAAVLASLAVLV